MNDLEPGLVIRILQLLWSIYSSTRARSKPAPDSEAHEPAVATEVPNPDRLRELIKKVEERPEQTEESISAAIEEKFSPTEAEQVKDDFAAFALLASPPDFADYNFFSLLEKYVKEIQAIASRADLFRLRGSKDRNEIRRIDMPETASSLLPSAAANAAVYPVGAIVSASVAERKAVLTNQQDDIPLVFLVEGRFGYASHGLGSGQRSERHVQTYKLGMGQESNWLAFYFEGNYPPGFKEFEYRLTASDVKAIIAGLKKDIIAYLRDVEEERPLVNELRRELDGLSSIISQT